MLCVGEGLEVRESGTHVEHTLAQLEAALQGFSAEELAELVVAYEPVWAIGTGKVAGPEDAQEMSAAIRAKLAELYSQEFADSVRVLYGGSVKAKNVASILQGADVDGAWWAGPAWRLRSSPTSPPSRSISSPGEPVAAGMTPHRG